MTNISLYIISTPRKPDNSMSDEVCSYCKKPSSMLLGVELDHLDEECFIEVQICKSCLLDGVQMIDEAILEDALLQGLIRDG
jgi:hypothetical protein